MPQGPRAAFDDEAALVATVDDKGLSLYAKLAQVTAEVGYVQKRGYNDFHKYAYVTEADLVDAVREKLAARNVILIPSAPSVTREGNLTTVTMSFTFCDGDSNQTLTAEWAGTGEDKGDKGLYKAYTGAVKYFLMKTFLIPTGDDPEGDTGTDRRAATPSAAPTAKRDTISTADAKKLYQDAQAAGVPDKRLAQAVAHYSGAIANRLDELTGPEALKLGAWLETVEAAAVAAKINDAHT